MNIDALMVAAAVAPAFALVVWARAKMTRADHELRAFVQAGRTRQRA